MSGRETKHMLQTICDACAAIEDIDGRPDGLDMSIQDLFIADIQRFFLYMSASDGAVAPKERDYMNALFGVKLTIVDYAKLIKDTNIRNIDFDEEIPLSLQILASFEANDDESHKEIKKAYPDILSMAFDFYKKAGLEFISCDKKVSTKEIEDLGLFLVRKKHILQELDQSENK